MKAPKKKVNTKKWRAAAAEWNKLMARYRESPDWRPTPEYRKALKRVAQEITLFLRSPDGASALRLLKASGQRIVIAEGMEVSWLLDYRGLGTQRFRRGGGVSWRKVAAATAVDASARRLQKKPEEIMTWIRHSLDAIAATAPRDKGGETSKDSVS